MQNWNAYFSLPNYFVIIFKKDVFLIFAKPVSIWAFFNRRTVYNKLRDLF